MEVLLPEGWGRPKGYSNGIKVKGETIYVAGCVGWNENEVFEHDDLVGQFKQCLSNILAILKTGGAGPEHMVRMTWYITDMPAYRNSLREIGAVYKEMIGKNFPVMACVGVAALVEEKAQIEIEVTAVLHE